MATKRWIGNAVAVAQVASGSIDSLDATPANNTFTVTIGGIAISTAGDTDVATTAAALVALLNASTHPYFSTITWDVPSGGNVRGTADTAGVPFTAVLSKSGGGSGTVTDFSDDTAVAGPSCLLSGDNYDDGSAPSSSDTVILANNAVNIAYELDNASVTSLTFVIEQTYTGLIGLPADSFASDVNGGTGLAAPEYRETYLKMGYSNIELGEFNTAALPNGSPRVKLDNVQSGASTFTILNTAAVGTDANLPCVRYKAAHANADLEVRNAPGGVGIAVESSDETSTIGDVIVSGGERAARVFVGDGVTLTNWHQAAGTHILRAAATITLVDVEGGELTINGDNLVTTLNVNGGTVYANNAGGSNIGITTANVNGGLLSGQRSGRTRTWSTVNLDEGTVIADDGQVTITTFDQPAGLRQVDVIPLN